jgi:hypothetical protein
MNRIEYQITKKPEEEEVGDGGRKKLEWPLAIALRNLRKV